MDMVYKEGEKTGDESAKLSRSQIFWRALFAHHMLGK